VVFENNRAVTSVELFGSNKNTFPVINVLMYGPTATGPWTVATSKSTRAATIFGANYTILGAAIDELGAAAAINQSSFVVQEDSGVEPGLWSPSTITTMAWYDADDTSTLSLLNGNFFQWRDKSGNGLHLTQNADANQPAYLTTGFNSLPTVSFDGVNDFLRADPIAAALANDDYTMFLVFSTALNLSTTEFVINMASSTCLYVFSANGQISVQYGSTASIVHPVNEEFGSGMILMMRRQGNSAITFADGSQIGSGTATFAASSLLSIGANHLGGNCSESKISELLFVKSAKDLEDRQRMEGYLAHKWGLVNELPPDHP
jgi:hypothetical protein